MRAEVKSAHIRALKARFMEKKNCDYPSMRPSLFGGGGGGLRTARMRNSTNLLSEERLRDVEMAEAQEEVSSVVVLFVPLAYALKIIMAWNDPTASQRRH